MSAIPFSPRRLRTVGIVLLPVLVAGLLGTTKVWAYSTAQINTLLENGTSTAVGWDRNFCRQNLYNNISLSGVNTLRASINGDGAIYQSSSYVDKSWLSGRGVPNTQSPTYVSWGQTTVPLQINSVTFLCRPLVSPETYSTTSLLPKSPYSLNLYNQTGYWVMSATNANDRAPNQIGTTNMRPARVDTFTKITNFTVNQAGASLSGIGATVYIQRNNSSRYWFPSGPVLVNYVGPPITQPLSLKITMYYKVVQGYHALSGPKRVETCTGRPAANNIDINTCDNKTTTLYITFAPNASLSAKTVSNRSTVFPGQTIRFTHTITKTGPGTATYYKRLCGAYSAAPNYYPGNCGARSIASNSYSEIHDFTVPINTTNIGAYYCERITYSVTATSADAGTSKAACVKVLPIAPSCGSFTVIPEGPDPRTTFSITTSVSSPTGTPYLPATMTLSLVPFPGNTYSYGPVTQAVTSTTYPAEATFGPIGPTNQTGQWQVNWSYTDAFGTTIQCGYNVDNTSILPIANKPYVSVYGGDVSAGVAAKGELASQTQTCVANPDAGIYSWNNHTSDFSGAGAQYATMALDQILDFSSASDTLNPASLSFANTGLDASQLNTGQGLFGGFFGGTTANCDFLKDVTVAPTNANMVIGPTAVGVGTQDVRYVVGHDVFINGDIIYAGTGGWADLSQIPYFKLVVVGGNIYIKNDVAQLDGIYVAEQDEDGNGGTISTCTNGANPVAPTDASFYTTCNHKLTINGAFAAQQIQFLRTFGTVGAASSDTRTANNAAEVFNYSPEVWLPRNRFSTSGAPIDAITGLPPVL